MSKHPYREMISDIVDATAFAIMGTLAFMFAFATVLSVMGLLAYAVWSALA